MAYRRRQQQGILESTTAAAADDFVDVEVDAAKAIRASSAHKDSSFSSAYGHGFLHSSPASPLSTPTRNPNPKDSQSHEYTSMKSLNEPKQGFWGSLARKAKTFLDDDNVQQQFEYERQSKSNLPQRQMPEGQSKSNLPQRQMPEGQSKSNLPQRQMPEGQSKPNLPQRQMPEGQSKSNLPQRQMPEKYQNINQSHDSNRKAENPTLHKGLGAIASSLNYIGNAVEEGLNIVENRTAGIIQETRKHIRKKPGGSMAPNQMGTQPHMHHQVRPAMQADQEIQLKASRDVAMAMAAKAKLLLRELKTVKADFAFAKERCAQLEEENKILRENRERGDSLEDDELVRLQLETLLAEKARLAHENSIYARENRFLREVVEYHQLTMQDVVYLDESTEEVTEVYPIKVPTLTNTSSMPDTSSALPSEASLDTSLRLPPNASIHPVPPPEFAEASQSSVWPSSQSRTKI